MARQGFAFMNTRTYVTPASGDANVIPTDGYPTVLGGQNTGWVTNNPDGGDNQNTTYSQIAGINYRQNSLSGSRQWRVDITGTKKIRIAAGHWSNAQTQVIDVRDSGGSKFTINANSSAGAFVDAAGTDRAASDWIANNAQSAEYTFADYVEVRIGGSGSNYTCLSYVEADDPAAGGTTRGMPFGARGTAFNGGRTFQGVLR